MQNNFGQLIAGILIGLVLGLIIAKQVFVPVATTSNTTTVTNTQDVKPSNNNNVTDVTTSQHTTGIPQKVYDVLKYIKQNHQAMDGYVGGRVFTNVEKIVPTQDNNGNPINYNEWDVNPHVQGVNRGTERILTGSDGRSWYTNDHYQTFTQIK